MVCKCKTHFSHDTQTRTHSCLLNSIESDVSLNHNHAHDGFIKLMPEAVLSQTGMEHHGKCEHHPMDSGPPRPVRRAYLTIGCDGHGVPEIAGEERRHVVSGVARTAAPHFFYHVRTFLDTLQHELIARHALAALRHEVHVNMRTTRLIYTIYTKTIELRHCLFHNVNESLDSVHQQHTA